jgi:hypothetical protein
MPARESASLWGRHRHATERLTVKRVKGVAGLYVVKIRARKWGGVEGGAVGLRLEVVVVVTNVSLANDPMLRVSQVTPLGANIPQAGETSQATRPVTLGGAVLRSGGRAVTACGSTRLSAACPTYTP